MLEGGWKTCASSVTLVVTIDINQTNPEVILHRRGIISHTLSPSPYNPQIMLKNVDLKTPLDYKRTMAA